MKLYLWQQISWPLSWLLHFSLQQLQTFLAWQTTSYTLQGTYPARSMKKGVLFRQLGVLASPIDLRDSTEGHANPSMGA